MGSYCVYKHTCPNGKAYIGITCVGTAKRWHNGRGYAKESHFGRAIRKYGWDNIEHEVLHDGMDEQTAKRTEIELIAYYKTQDSEHGYNMTAGGDGATGYHHTEENKRKHSNILLGNTFAEGYRHTEETKRKMSESRRGRNLGRKFSEETKRKISEATMGRGLGRKASDETKAKIAAANNKQVVMLLDSEEVARYKSAKDAALNIGVDLSGIARACRGRQKTAGGYQWRYALESESTARYASTLSLKGL